jgi:hypothetical protein
MSSLHPPGAVRLGVRGALILVLALALTSPVLAAGKKKTAAAPSAATGATTRTGLEALEKQVQEFTLPNGCTSRRRAS